MVKLIGILVQCGFSLLMRRIFKYGDIHTSADMLKCTVNTITALSAVGMVPPVVVLRPGLPDTAV